MQRRRLLIAPLATLTAVVAAATPQPARAQPPAQRVARIGWRGWTGDASGRPNAVLRAFRDGMAGFGWREGDNLHIETRAGERDFAGVPKGGVPQIVCKTNRFDEIFVPAQGARKCPADLGNLQCVREAGPEIIPFVVDEDLGLVFQTPKSGCVQDAVAVALKRSAIFRLVVQIGATL